MKKKRMEICKHTDNKPGKRKKKMDPNRQTWRGKWVMMNFSYPMWGVEQTMNGSDLINKRQGDAEREERWSSWFGKAGGEWEHVRIIQILDTASKHTTWFGFISTDTMTSSNTITESIDHRRRQSSVVVSGHNGGGTSAGPATSSGRWRCDRRR